ncbi:asparaginase [Cesiribacter andamanensis]|uniref:asparaginase n=1 Tax=Cesiribacter andamanensis AMV16 TaxID=1279009 RepID=M7NGF2_9BACT|nr:asparaginase [Cesiribacter andamanensis]EMR00905.1 L-asparaginase 1 [Cesiribacter andamanensis AMV16]
MFKPKVSIKTAAPRDPEASLLIIYTGGTLGMVYDKEGTLIPFDFEQILDRIPSLSRFNLQLTVLSFEELIDSSNATPETWQAIGAAIRDNYELYDGFVVIHGTDTMAYSASALSFMLQNLQKPVIFTGAQLPIGAVRTDARENLLAALEIASAKNHRGDALVPEVCIYFNYRLLRGNRAKKVQSILFDAFESNNYPLLAEAGVEIQYKQEAILTPDYAKPLSYSCCFDNRVALLKLFPGMEPRYVEHLLELPDLRGLILETYGSGNAPTFPWFIRAVEGALAAGKIILNVSQCLGGKVMQGRYGTSRLLEDMGVLSGYDLTSEAALAKMMLILAAEPQIEAAKKRIISPCCGEMSLQ